MLSKNFIKIFVVFLLVVLVSPLIFADQIVFNFYRDDYKKFETVQLNVSIEGITLSKDLELSNFVLLDNSNQVAIAKNKVKVNDNFYVFYFDVSSLNEGEYRLGLVDVAYTESGISKFGDFFTNFSVVNGSSQILSVRPAYVLSKVLTNQEASFSLIINNKGNDSVLVSLDKEGDFFSLNAANFTLFSGGSKTVNVVTSLAGKQNAGFLGNIYVRYSGINYQIPFTVLRTDFVASNETSNQTNVTFIPLANLSNVVGAISLTTISDRLLTNLSLSVNAGEYFSPGQIVVKNNANVDLNNLTYFITGNISSLLELQPDSADFIGANGSAIFLLGLSDSELVAGTYSGYLEVKSAEGANTKLPLIMEVIGEQILLINKTNITSLDNKTNLSVGNFTSVEDEGISNGLLAFFIVLAVLLLILLYLYKKTRPKQKSFESFVESVKSRRN